MLRHRAHATDSKIDLKRETKTLSKNFFDSLPKEIARQIATYLEVKADPRFRQWALRKLNELREDPIPSAELSESLRATAIERLGTSADLRNLAMTCRAYFARPISTVHSSAVRAYNLVLFNNEHPPEESYYTVFENREVPMRIDENICSKIFSNYQPRCLSVTCCPCCRQDEQESFTDEVKSLLKQARACCVCGKAACMACMSDNCLRSYPTQQSIFSTPKKLPSKALIDKPSVPRIER